MPNDEPLRLECEHFIDCVAQGSAPAPTARPASAVVRVLEALQASLDSGGAPQPVGAAVGA